MKYMKMEINVFDVLRKGAIYPAFLRHLSKCIRQLKI